MIKIRHMYEDDENVQQDVHVILLCDYHYTKGLDKYLRQANLRVFTSIGSSEENNMLEIVGKRNARMVREFAQKYVASTGKKVCSFKLGKKHKFEYHYKNSFVVALLWNNSRLRYIVFPRREWIDAHFTICYEGTQVGDASLKTTLSAEAFFEEGHKKWEPSFKAAWKVEDALIGIDTFGQKTTNARYWIRKVMGENVINRDKVWDMFELTIQKPTSTKKHSTKALQDKAEEEKSETPDPEPPAEEGETDMERAREFNKAKLARQFG